MLLVCSATVAQDEAALLAPVSAPPVVPGKQWVVDIAALDQQRAMRVMLERSPVGVELATDACTVPRGREARARSCTRAIAAIIGAVADSGSN